MKRPRSQAGPPAAALVIAWGLALLASAVACGQEGDHPYGRGLYVRASWQEARDVVGHRVHVIEHKIACNECHDMTGTEVDLPRPSACASCHAREARIDHALDQAREKLGEASPADCSQCHAFTLHEGEAPDAWACLRCHDAPQGDTPAVAIHAQSTCDTCHRPHGDPQALPSDCASCHDIATDHATAGRKPGEVCATCHQKQHAPADHARTTCAPCHAEAKPIIPATALFSGHDECTGCHRPHDYAPTNAVACRDCHANVPVLGGGRIAAHADCKNCHDPHAVSAKITRACVSCHQGRATDHPAVAAGAVCASCHDPHPPMGQKSPARECSHCHHAAANDSSFHGGTQCETCHRPHQFRLSAGTALCRNCHGSNVAAATVAKGHADCSACHSGLPHRPATQSARCEGCHGAQASRAIAGHRACANCHEPHGGAIIKRCVACHDAVPKQAPAGHQSCGNCHEAHAGTAKASCSSCHAGQARAPHGNIAGGCATCHSAHGPKGATHSPGCVSCHAVRTLPALHQEPKHQRCSTCHRTHQTRPVDERAVCLSCHRDRVDHFADGPRCSSCHLFE
jgi:hypothetical protein